MAPSANGRRGRSPSAQSARRPCPGIATRNWPSRYPLPFLVRAAFQAHGSMLRSWGIKVHRRPPAALTGTWLPSPFRPSDQASAPGSTEVHARFAVAQAGCLAPRCFARAVAAAGADAPGLGPGPAFRVAHPRRRGRRAGAGSPASRSASTRASRPIGEPRAKPACRRDSTGAARRTRRRRGDMAGPAAGIDAGSVANVYDDRVSFPSLRQPIRKARRPAPCPRFRHLQGHLHSCPRPGEPRRVWRGIERCRDQGGAQDRAAPAKACRGGPAFHPRRRANRGGQADLSRAHPFGRPRRADALCRGAGGLVSFRFRGQGRTEGCRLPGDDRRAGRRTVRTERS